MTISESYVDLIAGLVRERDALQAEVNRLRGIVALAELARDSGQYDLPVSGLPRTLEDDGEGY